MNRYLAVGKGGFKTALVYRFHFYTTIFTAPVTLIIYYFLWQSIYNYSGQEIIRGFTFPALISYFAISMIVGFFTWTFVDQELENNVRHGYLVGFLLKPINFIYWQFMFEAGFSFLSVILEMIPLFLIGILIFKMQIASWSYFILFFVSLALAIVLDYLLGYIVGMSTFWLGKISGIRKLKRVSLTFLSGGFIPLAFFPAGFQTVSHYLPFEYTRYVPINIYLEKLSYLESFEMLGLQIVWIGIMFFIANIIWKRAFKKFTGAGT